MSNKRLCPDCGHNVYRDPQVGMTEFACLCGWEEGGPLDHGHLFMTERPACPVLWCPTCGKDTPDGGDCGVCAAWWKANPPPVDPIIAAELDRCGL